MARTLIVDGRNVQRSLLAEHPLRRLVELVRDWAKRNDVSPLVVFDGAHRSKPTTSSARPRDRRRLDRPRGALLRAVLAGHVGPRASRAGRARRRACDRRRQFRPRADAVAARRDRVRLRTLVGGASAERPRRERAEGRGPRFRVRDDLGPFPSVDRQPGERTVRLERDRRGGPGDRAHPTRDRRHVSHDPHPPRDRRARRGDERGPDERALLPRRRLRREFERAHPRRPLARSGRAARDARGSDRRHAAAVAGRLPDASRQALHRRERAPLHASR